MFRSFNQSVSVRDSLNLFKLSSLNERLKSFFSLLCGKTSSENNPINHCVER